MDIKYWFPYGSKTFQELNFNSVSSSPQSEPPFCNESLAKDTGKAKNAGKIGISVTSYRRRSLDPDNLCAKYFVDALRYQGIIKNDREEDITYSISQKKVQKKTQEKTLIVITYD